MIKQYIVTDDLQLVNIKETGIWKVFNDLVQQGLQPTTNTDEEFIGLKELCKRLSTARQTIYNKIGSGILVEGVHFFKPTGGKLLFKWSAMLEWVESSGAKLPPSTNPQSQQKIEQTDYQNSQVSLHSKQKTANTDFINI